MSDPGLAKIGPGEKFYFDHEIVGMRWRVGPGCNEGGEYEVYQNWSIRDEDDQEAGLLLPVDREMKTTGAGGGWHELRVVEDDCGTSPDDHRRRHLQKVQFKPTAAPAPGAPEPEE